MYLVYPEYEINFFFIYLFTYTLTYLLLRSIHFLFYPHFNVFKCLIC